MCCETSYSISGKFSKWFTQFDVHEIFLEQNNISQVVTAKLLNKPKGLESVAMKVAMQMACKLGGEPWIVALPQITGLMIIGKFFIQQK